MITASKGGAVIALRHGVLTRHSAGGMEDEAALVRAAQQNPAAFAQIYHYYRHRVYAYLRTRVIDAEDAADLTQQVFLQAMEALPRYHPRAVPFGAWLFRIARNAAIDAQRHHRGTIAWEDVPAALEPQGDDDPETEILQREALVHLHTLLHALDPETRDLLLLRFAARLTAAEIGAVIGTSAAAASKRLARALQMLKEQYDDTTR